MDELKQATILVVDDTPANLKLLETTLTAQGYRVLTSPRGELALKVAERSHPDLILLDINMPGMNGFEVCAELKKSEGLQDIPVLFISAYTDVEDKVKAFDAGGVDYVSKPFQEKEVLARVDTHLRLNRQRLELEANYKRVNELTALRENLTHMIVHDLRSPLSAVSMTLSLMGGKFRSELPENIAELVGNASSSVARMVEMIGSMLDLDRLEAGEMPVQFEEILLSTVLDEVLAMFDGLYDHLSFETKIPEPETGTRCDRNLIHRVFVNLLANAVRFSPRNGTIRVIIQAGDGETVVSVADQGPGIPEEAFGAIFDKFGQAEQAKSLHSSGIGLAFCKLAVEAHGGRIWVESELEKGSQFNFTIPGRRIE